MLLTKELVKMFIIFSIVFFSFLLFFEVRKSFHIVVYFRFLILLRFGMNIDRINSTVNHGQLFKISHIIDNAPLKPSMMLGTKISFIFMKCFSSFLLFCVFAFIIAFYFVDKNNEVLKVLLKIDNKCTLL